MKRRMSLFCGMVGAIFSVCLVLFGSANAGEVKHEHASEAMQMHHLHTLMTHGLAMAAEGSTMVMLAEMKMSPSIDPVTMKHGREMIQHGKGVIEKALSGPLMKGIHKTVQREDPLMKYTHELGEAIMKVVDMLEKMQMEGSMTADMMTMHHMHIMINHALGMAAEGANMVMLGQMGMAKDIDAFSVEHGKMMLSEARAVITEVMEGTGMKEMHAHGVKKDDAMMAETHKMSEASLKVIDLLSKMPASGSK